MYSANASPSRCARRASGFGCLPVHPGAVFGCRDREQLLPQHRPVQGGDGEPAVTPPVPVLDHPERRSRLRLPLLGVQLLGFVGLADLRRDDLQDPVPEDPQLPGVVVDGVPDQRSPAHPPRSGVEVGGQRLDRRHDHLGLVDQQPTLRQRHPGRLERLRPERGGEPGLAVRRGTGLLRWRAPTSSRYWWHPSRLRPPRSGRGGRPGAAARLIWATSRVSSTIASRVSLGASSTRPVRPGRSSGCRRSGQPRTGSGVPDRWCPRCSPWTNSSTQRRHSRTRRQGLWTTSTTPSLVDATWLFARG